MEQDTDTSTVDANNSDAGQTCAHHRCGGCGRSEGRDTASQAGRSCSARIPLQQGVGHEFDTACTQGEKAQPWETIPGLVQEVLQKDNAPTAERVTGSGQCVFWTHIVRQNGWWVAVSTRWMARLHSQRSGAGGERNDTSLGVTMSHMLVLCACAEKRKQEPTRVTSSGKAPGSHTRQLAAADAADEPGMRAPPGRSGPCGRTPCAGGPRASSTHP